jgi:hypothetical protein
MSKIDNIEVDQKEVMDFFATMRGQFIVSQALSVAIKTLESVEPEVMQETSNIEDMKYLMKNLFPLYAAVEQASNEAVEQFEQDKAE